jgi:hypothetical protein
MPSTLRQKAKQAARAAVQERDARLDRERAQVAEYADQEYQAVTGEAPPAWEPADRGSHVLAATVDGIRFEYRPGLRGDGGFGRTRGVWISAVDGKRVPVGTGYVRSLEDVAEVVSRMESVPEPKPDALTAI